MSGSLTLLVVVAVPGEVGGVGTESSLGREGELAAVEVGEFEMGATGEDGFGDVGLATWMRRLSSMVQRPASKRSWAVGVNNGVRPH
jgi:hypothetical protein